MVRPWRDDDAAIREERKDFWRLFLRDPSSRTRYYCWKLARAKTNRARRRDVLAIEADRLRVQAFLAFFSRGRLAKYSPTARTQASASSIKGVIDAGAPPTEKG
jgi:hypothetical protein